MAAGRSLQQQVVNPMEKRVKVLKLTPHDNVGTALQDLKKGDTFQIILDGKVIGEDTLQVVKRSLKAQKRSRHFS